METEYTKKDDSTVLKSIPPKELNIETLYKDKAEKERVVEEATEYFNKAKLHLEIAEKLLAEVIKDISEAEKLGIVKE